MKTAKSLLCLALLLASILPAVAADREKVLDFDTMVGVSGPFKGTANPINGVNGGGLAWTIAVGRGKLRTDGELTITVRGLVFAEGPNAGSNTLPGFRGLVSCRTIDGTGAPALRTSRRTSSPRPRLATPISGPSLSCRTRASRPSSS